MFYHILGKVTVKLTYNPILASRTRSLRICLLVRLQTILILRHIVTYIWTEFEISLSHQINLTKLMCLSYIRQTDNLTCHPILASWTRSRRKCPGVRLRTTLIFWHIVTHAWPQFDISLTHQINLIVLMSFILFWAKWLSIWPTLPS